MTDLDVLRFKLRLLFKQSIRMRWLSESSSCEYYSRDGFMRCSDGETIPYIRFDEMTTIEEIENNHHPEFKVKYTLKDSYLNPENKEDDDWVYLKFIKGEV